MSGWRAPGTTSNLIRPFTERNHRVARKIACGATISLSSSLRGRLGRVLNLTFRKKSRVDALRTVRRFRRSRTSIALPRTEFIKRFVEKVSDIREMEAHDLLDAHSLTHTHCNTECRNGQDY
ncbi:hypothetical protein Bbelb_090300 [Branchiostoma belcheri]|nr:hypothetical protein Bbelb_090300 [Branchiostoma belcheri]